MDKVSIDVLQDRVGIVVKIVDMIIQSRLWWYGHVLHEGNSQLREIMELEITGKRNRGQSRKLWEECKRRIWNDKA